MPYKVLFCGTPLFAVPTLAALHAHPSFELLRVFSQPDRPAGRGKKLKASAVKMAAMDFKIPVETPEKISNIEIIQQIKNEKIDVGVVVAYGQILSQDFLDAFNIGCVNVHSSLLPRWRGAAPMQRALMAGDKQTGVSLQKVVKKLDAGPVIAEKKIEIPMEMGATLLYSTLSQLGASLVCENLADFIEGKSNLKEQNESDVTYAKKIEKDEAWIDWSQPAWDIHNKIRGLDMGGPYASSRFRGKALKLHVSKFVKSDHQARPGMVVEVGPSSFNVACGESEVEILMVQPESKAKMAASDFIRGYHLKEGDCFEF